MRQDEKLDSKPRTLKELAHAYNNVDKRTFKQWLQCEELKDIKPNGRYYMIPQVKAIVKHLGEP